MSISWSTIVQAFNTSLLEKACGKRFHFDSVKGDKLLIDGGRDNFWNRAILLDAIVCFHTGNTHASSKRTYNQHFLLKESVEEVLSKAFVELGAPGDHSTGYIIVDSIRSPWTSFGEFRADAVSQRFKKDVTREKVGKLCDACDLSSECSLPWLLDDVVRRIWESSRLSNPSFDIIRAERIDPHLESIGDFNSDHEEPADNGNGTSAVTDPSIDDDLTRTKKLISSSDASGIKFLSKETLKVSWVGVIQEFTR